MLLEGVPGLAKTLIISTLAATMHEHNRPLARDRRDLVENVGLVGQRRSAELEDEDFAHVVYSAFSMT